MSSGPRQASPSARPERALPASLAMSRLMAAGSLIEGGVALSRLERLADVLADTQGEVSVRLELSIDDEGRRLLSGQVQADVQVFCQRCLESMPLRLRQDVSLALVLSEEQGRQLPDELDPLLIEGDVLALHHLVEEELLLGLPIVSVHEGDCGERAYFAVEETLQTAPTQRPFENLADMLSKN